MNEFIEKLICRLEEEKYTREEKFQYDTRMQEKMSSYNKGLNTAIRTVNELAEEYAHCALCYLQGPCEYQNENAEMPTEYWERDWIPCENELPPYPNPNPYFEGKNLELYLATVKGADYPFRVFWNGKIFTDGWGEQKVIAWQPLPAPYNPKGE